MSEPSEKQIESSSDLEKALTQRPPSRIANAAPTYVLRPPYYLFIISVSESWRDTFINYSLLVGYSPSHPPHFCYPFTTSMHVGFIRQMSSLAWLYSLVVSCNSLLECGSSREATCLELQASWKASSFLSLLFLFPKKKDSRTIFKIPHSNFKLLLYKKRVIVSNSLNLSFCFFRLLLDVLFRHPHPRVRRHSCIL